MRQRPGLLAWTTFVRLDDQNRPQPDVYVRVLKSHGGRTRIAADGYTEGTPEFVAEVAATRAAYDLHAKLEAYRPNDVREYVVLRTYDAATDWFVLRGGRFARLRPGADGVLRSRVFPGLWLDPAALLRGDVATVLKVVQAGVSTKEHAAFVDKLRKAADRQARRGGA